MPTPLAQAGFATLWQPPLIVLTVGLQVAYILAVRSGLLRIAAGRAVLFSTGLFVFYLAFGTPIDYLSDHFLFSVHMVQHLLEILVMVPLLMAGIPASAFHGILRRPLAAQLFRGLTHPVGGLLMLASTLVVFHLPAVYDLTLRSESFHFAEHAAFLVAAFCFWWPLAGDDPDRPRLAGGMRVFYLVWATNLMMPLNVLLVFTRQPWYHPYTLAPRLWGLSALADQQAGGLIMALGILVVFAGVAVRALVRYDPAYWYA